MNAFRHYVALIFTIMLPPMILMWVLIHRFIGFWRKAGAGWTYLIVTAVVWSGDCSCCAGRCWRRIAIRNGW
jgi:hypothetical protein